MGRMKKKAQRQQRYKRIVRGESVLGDAVLDTADKVRANVARHGQTLKDAQIGFLWWYNVRRTADGLLSLGKPKKVGEAEKEFGDLDFLIFVNYTAWEAMDDAKRRALLDHELTHCDVAKDKDGEVKTDAKGRTCWRVRKHDLEEFHDVYERRGAWTANLEKFVKAGQGKLFSERMPKGGKKGEKGKAA